MDSHHQIFLTQEGIEELKREYKVLTEEKRPETVKRVAVAREQGDLSENSEYAAAKDELTFIDGRIQELEEIMRHAKIVGGTHSKSAVGMGCQVTVTIDGKRDTFTIVGEWEANPKEKKISHSSPLGKALIGKKVGEKIEVEAPAGRISYKIVNIE